MFEELFHLLSQLGLGAAARPVCDFLADVAGETMTLQQLQQEIRNVLRPYGRVHRTGAVISALVELGLAAVASASEENEDSGAAAAEPAPPPGTSVVGDSVLLAAGENTIVIDHLRAVQRIHELARDWLDIDGGIYFDVSQHDAGSDSER